MRDQFSRRSLIDGISKAIIAWKIVPFIPALLPENPLISDNEIERIRNIIHSAIKIPIEYLEPTRNLK